MPYMVGGGVVVVFLPFSSTSPILFASTFAPLRIVLQMGSIFKLVRIANKLYLLDKHKVHTTVTLSLLPRRFLSLVNIFITLATATITSSGCLCCKLMKTFCLCCFFRAFFLLRSFDRDLSYENVIMHTERVGTRFGL